MSMRAGARRVNAKHGGSLPGVLGAMSRSEPVDPLKAQQAARYFERARAIGGPAVGSDALWALAAKLAEDEMGEP